MEFFSLHLVGNEQANKREKKWLKLHFFDGLWLHLSPFLTLAYSRIVISIDSFINSESLKLKIAFFLFEAWNVFLNCDACFRGNGGVKSLKGVDKNESVKKLESLKFSENHKKLNFDIFVEEKKRKNFDDLNIVSFGNSAKTTTGWREGKKASVELALTPSSWIYKSERKKNSDYWEKKV